MLNEFINIFKDITIKNSFNQRYDKITVNACYNQKIGTTFNTRGCGAGESLVGGVRRNQQSLQKMMASTKVECGHTFECVILL